VCVIHDRHKGILQATNDIKDGSREQTTFLNYSFVIAGLLCANMSLQKDSTTSL
jgi:hypothetical protein